MSGDEVRLPPHSEPAERGVIGSMLLEPLECVATVRLKFQLGPEAFYLPAHRVMVETVYAMADDGIEIDVLTFCQKLKDRGDLEKVGGNSYVEQVIMDTPTAAHCEHYAQIVRQKLLLRVARDRAMSIVQAVDYGEDDGDKVLSHAASTFAEAIGSVTKEASNADDLKSVCEIMDRHSQVRADAWRLAYDEARREGASDERARHLAQQAHDNAKVPLVGLPTPWEGINELTAGIRRGEYTMVAGRPSEGKTTLEGSLAVHWSQVLGLPGVRITNDSPRQTLLARDACRMAGVSLPKIMRGFARPNQREKFREACRVVESLPMWIVQGETNIDVVATRLRAMKAKHGIEWVSVDYLQQLRTGDRKIDSDARMRAEVVSARMKLLLQDLKIHGLILSQLSRDSVRNERAPRLEDLRDSGSLEQDADMIFMVYRNRDEDAGPIQSWAGGPRPTFIDLQKSKNTATGAMSFWMHAHYFRFTEAEPGWSDLQGMLAMREQRAGKPEWARAKEDEDHE